MTVGSKAAAAGVDDLGIASCGIGDVALLTLYLHQFSRRILTGEGGQKGRAS